MGRRKAFRRRIKQPDEFLTTTERAIEFVRENPARAGVVAGAVLLLLALVWGSGRYVSYRRNKIVDLEGEAFTLYREAREDGARIPEALKKLESLYAEYPGTGSGQTALYQAANLHFLEGNYGKALEEYRLLTEKHRKNGFLYPLALRNLAYTLEQTGDLQSSRQSFEELLSMSTGLPKAQLDIDLARVYGKLGDTGKVKSFYQDIVDTYPKSPWAAEAREKLGLPPEDSTGKDM